MINGTNNNSDDDNDSSNIQNEIISDDEYEERVKDIKSGILKVKLTLFKDIFYLNIRRNFLVFQEKVRRKYNLEKLYIKAVKNQSLRRQQCINFIVVCHKIITQKETILSLYAISYLLWYSKSKRQAFLFSKFTRACIILSNIFHKTLWYAFHKLPCNYLYLKYAHDKMVKTLLADDLVKEINSQNKEINLEKIMNNSFIQFRDEKRNYFLLNKKRKLLILLTKHNFKNCVNRSLFYAFRRLKTLTTSYIQNEKENRKLDDMLIDLKCDLLINGSLMLKIILDKNLRSELFIFKRKFYDNLVSKVKLMNTLVDYSHNYKKIPNLLQNNNKIDLLVIRNQYRKIFALYKILLVRENKKNLFTDKNLNLKDSYLQGCFYRWKGTVCNEVLHKNKKILGLRQFVLKMNQLLYLNDKNKFLTRLIIFGCLKKKKNNFYENFFENLGNLIKLFVLKRRIYVFYRIFYPVSFTIQTIQNKYIASNLLFFIYKKHNFSNSLYRSFIYWKSLSYLLSYEDKVIEKKPAVKEVQRYTSFDEKEFFKKLTKLLFIINLKTKKVYNAYFLRWKYSLKKNYYKSHVSVDSMIIQNMSTILLEYENEDTKLKHEITNLKTTLKKNQCLIHLIYSKSYNTLFYYFTRWNKNIFSFSNFKELLAQSEQIKKENDVLINTYYEKKNQYKKTIYDYEYMKKHYCKDCMGEDFEVDYKSINNEIFTNEESNNNMNQADSNDSDMHIDTDEDLNNINRINSNTEGNKIADKENLIKEYQNEYNQQLKYYEDYITTMQKKKEELYELKKMLLNKKESKS